MSDERGTRAGETPRRTEPGGGRHHGPHPASAANPERSLDPVFDDEALDAALQIAPRGALVMALSAVTLMLIAWLALYFFLFLPRGPIS